MIDPKITDDALKSIRSAATAQELENLRVKYLGRKGLVTAELKAVSELPIDERTQAGKAANLAKQRIEDEVKSAQKRLRQEQVEAESERPLDLTLPAPGLKLGHSHPVSNLQDELIRIFWQMGYEIADGPEVETDWYNFEALNLHADHPARDMQDTFYLEGPPATAGLPRTHTSSVQIRYMEKNQPPIRIIAPGKVYRNEDEDPRHIWMFTQAEGLVVDKGIGISDLKGTLLTMVKGLLGDEAEIRLRPSYFPYTEPSIEVDASCVICKGQGCATCSQTGWIELLGSGMVHPQVLKNVGIDPEIYTGFAFGVGLERLAAVKFGVEDLRNFWRPNLKFLEQF